MEIDMMLHNRLIGDAKTCLDTRLSHGAKRLREIKKKAPSWGISYQEKKRLEADLAAHERFIQDTVPGVDTAAPQRALDMMSMRHERPNLGEGSWVLRQTVKENRAFHDRMLQEAHSHVDVSKPETMGSIPLGPLTRGGVLRKPPLCKRRKAFSKTTPGPGISRRRDKGLSPIHDEGAIGVALELGQLKEALARKGLVLSQEEWGGFVSGLARNPDGTLGRDGIAELLRVPVKGGSLKADHGVLRQPWDDPSTLPPEPPPNDEHLPHFAWGRTEDNLEYDHHVTRFPLFSGHDFGSTAHI